MKILPAFAYTCNVFFHFFLMFFFGIVFGMFLATRGLPGPPKMHKHVNKKHTPNLEWFFITNLNRKYVQNVTNINPNTHPKSYQKGIRSNSTKHVFAFRILQKSRLVSPKTFAKRYQNPLKIQPKKQSNFGWIY